MRRRVTIAILVFMFAAAASAIPAAIFLAIVGIYLSGHGIPELGSVQVFPGMDGSNFLFIMATIFSGFIGIALYWRFSKPN